MSERYRVVQGSRDDDVRWTVYRGDRPVETFAARAVAEECARALNTDLEAVEANRAIDEAADVALADAPTDEPAFEPTPEDRSEAGQLFGELEEDLDVAEFEAWLEGLHHERFRQVSQAIDVLRGALAEFRGDVDRRDGADWID